MIGDTLTCSYRGLGEKISDLHSLRAVREEGLWLLHQVPISGHRLGLRYMMVSIPICGEQTGNELRLHPTQHWSHWRPWGRPTPVWGSQEVNLP